MITDRYQEKEMHSPYHVMYGCCLTDATRPTKGRKAASGSGWGSAWLWSGSDWLDVARCRSGPVKEGAGWPAGAAPGRTDRERRSRGKESWQRVGK